MEKTCLQKTGKTCRVCSDCKSLNFTTYGYYPVRLKCGDCGHKGTMLVDAEALAAI